MNRKMIPLVFVLAVTGGLTGCVIAVDGDNWDDDSHVSWQKSQKVNRDNLAKIELGMSAETVRQIMGTADFNELYQRDGAPIQVLYYRTHRANGDGTTTKDECTPIVITNGVVTGWGSTAFSDSVSR